MRRRVLCTVSLVLLLAVGAAAQMNNPAWLDEVADQAADKLGCEVTLFLLSREGTLADRRTYDVRLQCADGRRFDASRIEPETKYTFAACDTQAC